MNSSILKEFTSIADRLRKLSEENKANAYEPYPTQGNFLADKRQVKVMLAGNQLGKSRTGSYEVQCHLTGNYPPWWKGIKFKTPVTIWVAGVSATRVRDTIQETLFGGIGRMGTGMIPASCIIEDKIIKKSGIPQAIDIAPIKHVSGGTSYIQFFSYDQGREKFQGSTIEMIWFDEEPPEDIYNECKMRVLVKRGYIILTFTPLGGVTALYDALMTNDKVGKHHLPLSEAKHITPEMMAEMLEGMDESEILARRDGIATVGTKLLFRFKQEEYVCEDFEPSPHWRCIGGLDVGIAHPTSAVMIHVDDTSGCYYVTREYEANGKTALDHKHVLKPWGIEFACDPSAWNRQIGTGESTASIYLETDSNGKSKGLKLIKANNDVDASIHGIRSAIAGGKFWIFKSCQKLIRQMRLYRTKEDGHTIYKVDDDLCLAGDNKILTRQFGWEQIDNLVGKEFDVMTPIGWCRAWNVHSKGLKNCVTTTLNNGCRFTHTVDHKFLIENNGFSVASIDHTRYIINRGIIDGASSDYGNKDRLQRDEILFGREIPHGTDGSWRENKTLPTTSGGMGIPQWSNIEWFNACSSCGRGQIEQLNLKPKIDECFRSRVASHDGEAKNVGQEQYADSCSACGSEVASLARGESEGEGGCGEAGWVGRQHPDSYSYMRDMREIIPVPLSGKKNDYKQDEVLWIELQNESVQGAQEEPDECRGYGNGDGKGVYVLRQAFYDKQTGHSEVLQTNLLSEGVQSTEDAGSRLVYDLSVDIAHCFYLDSGVIASNCDAARYAFMAKDKAAIPGKSRVEAMPTVEEWRPASPYGY